jgi:hypothetical protein
VGTIYDQLTTSWRAALMSGSDERLGAGSPIGACSSWHRTQRPWGHGNLCPRAAPSSTSPGQAGVRLEEADWFVSDGEQRVEADQRLESTTTTTTTTTTRMLSGSYQPR